MSIRDKYFAKANTYIIMFFHNQANFTSRKGIILGQSDYRRIPQDTAGSLQMDVLMESSILLHSIVILQLIDRRYLLFLMNTKIYISLGVVKNLVFFHKCDLSILRYPVMKMPV